MGRMLLICWRLEIYINKLAAIQSPGNMPRLTVSALFLIFSLHIPSSCLFPHPHLGYGVRFPGIKACCPRLMSTKGPGEGHPSRNPPSRSSDCTVTLPMSLFLFWLGLGPASPPCIRIISVREHLARSSAMGFNKLIGWVTHTRSWALVVCNDWWEKY